MGCFIFRETMDGENSYKEFMNSPTEFLLIISVYLALKE